MQHVRKVAATVTRNRLGLQSRLEPEKDSHLKASCSCGPNPIRECKGSYVKAEFGLSDSLTPVADYW